MLHRGHWDDAYAYVLRSQPDNIPQHEDTYKRNAQVWHYTNARINELIQEAEQALEIQDKHLDSARPSSKPSNPVKKHRKHKGKSKKRSQSSGMASSALESSPSHPSKSPGQSTSTLVQGLELSDTESMSDDPDSTTGT